MARILVADDNSNIQKMVGLALKDQGIDVVAVGNGEAAVRKISDIKPDLVLADVFMPVRNGYEVCKYVKDDPALAHIPVILLVGAFDPLDEQEAQRVGADGVLKKPFVPPDPLISMVKSALARAGVSYSAASTSTDKAPQHDALKTSDLAPRQAPVLPTLARVPVPAPAPTPVESPRDFEPVLEDVSFVEDVVTKPEPVRIDAGSQTLAFGSMLETQPSGEEETAFVPPVEAEFARERDWRAGKEEEEAEEKEEDEPKHSWRRDAADSGDEAVAAQGTTGAGHDWRETAFAETPARKHGYDGWQPTKEKTAFAEAEDSVAAVATETRPPAVVVAEQVAPAASFTGDAWAAAIAAGSDEKPAVEEEVTPAAEEAQPAVETKVQESVPVVAETPAIPAESETRSPGESWFSTPSSPWDAVAHKASQLASSWDAAVAPQNGTGLAVDAPTAQHSGPAAAEVAPFEQAQVEASGATTIESSVSQDSVRQANDRAEQVAEGVAVPAGAIEAIREEVTHYSGDPIISPATAGGEEVAKTAAPATNLHDDLVARVLAKMSPEMLQAVTREILKPVVEAMVQEELNSKKQ